MEQTPESRPRLNVLGKAARRKRIFAKLREGWAYDEIAREERVSPERIRQIVSEVLGKRVIDRGADHAHLQLERLMPALRLAGEAIGRGELKAVAPLIKVIDRLDKHQNTVVSKYEYGPEERQRLMDKINRLADNLQPPEPDVQAEEADENNSAEIPV
jgi:DNA polymerase II large subunit